MANTLTTSQRAGQLVSRAGKYLGELISGNFEPVLDANKQINKISGFHKAGMGLASPIEFLSRWGHESGGITDAFARTFMKNPGIAEKDILDAAGKVVREKGTRDWGMSNIRKGKLAMGVAGLGIMGGVAGGLTHDTAGNADIAGLPGI